MEFQFISSMKSKRKRGGTPVPRGNPSSKRGELQFRGGEEPQFHEGGTTVPPKTTIKNPFKNTTKTEAEVVSEKKNKRIEFEPIFLEASDPSKGICYGIPSPELQNIEDKSYYTTLQTFLFSKCNDVSDIETNAPICKQVLYALEYCTASAIFTKSHDVFTYLQYWKKYAELFRDKERTNTLDDLKDYIKKESDSLQE